MYCRLAWGNVRTSFRDYGIYLITIAFGVAVFYAFNTIGEQTAFLSQSTSEVLKLLATFMGGLTVFLACVLGFLMVYANNFLVRRRKREIGLYQVLGMTKRQVSVVICLECGIASLLAYAIGLGLGVLLSQFLIFVTAALFNDTISQFGFIFSEAGLWYSAICFGFMFVVTLLFDIAIVGKVKIVDLMQGERRVESQRVRPVWLCSIIAVAGIVILGIAYWRLLTDGLPVFLDAEGEMVPFAVTTALCVVGTLALFWGLPTPAMAICRHVKGYYLRDLHLFTVRQVASRVNSSAIAMGATALVLFLAMTSVTGGMSIASGLNLSLENGSPYTATVVFSYAGRGGPATMGLSDLDGAEIESTSHPADVASWFEEAFASVQGDVGAQNQVDVYESVPEDVESDDGTYATYGYPTLGAFGEVSGMELPQGVTEQVHAELQVIPLSEYNGTRAILGMEPVELDPNTYLFLSNLGPKLSAYFDAGLAAGIRFTVGGRELVPAEARVIKDKSAALYDASYGSNTGTLVVADELVEGLPLHASILQIQAVPGAEDALDEEMREISNDLFVGYVDDQYTLGDGRVNPFLYVDGEPVAFYSMISTRADAVETSATMTGIIGYLATYIGFVLVVGCAAILAIQQLSQAADSLGRYRLLHEIGAPAQQVDRSVLSQTALSFGFPLLVGFCHSIVALTVLAEVMALLTPVDVTSSIGLTAAIFVLVYGGYFLATYLMARRLADARYLGLRTG